MRLASKPGNLRLPKLAARSKKVRNTALKRGYVARSNSLISVSNQCRRFRIEGKVHCVQAHQKIHNELRTSQNHKSS